MSFVFKPILQGEGQGARIKRAIGGTFVPRLDPFLMLDFARVKLPAGFPDHPHRGFDTVSYLLEGAFYHEDFRGGRGKSSAGDIMWLTAGKGIMHSELPFSFEEESVGFQLWINLPKGQKLVEPSYQSFTRQVIPSFTEGKAKVKINCGTWNGQVGPVISKTPVYYFDVSLEAQGQITLPIPAKWNSLIFVHDGNVNYQDKHHVDKEEACVLETSLEGDLNHKFSSKTGGKFIFISGEPIGEPIFQKGPFVMNTEDEVEQAYADFKAGVNGFEGAPGWESRNRQLKTGIKYEDLWADAA